jgi:hypothetical protein
MCEHLRHKAAISDADTVNMPSTFFPFASRVRAWSGAGCGGTAVVCTEEQRQRLIALRERLLAEVGGN